MKKFNLAVVAFFLLNVILLSSIGISQTERTTLMVGDKMVYEGTSTAVYRMYARSFEIIIGDNSTYPIKGTFIFTDNRSNNLTNVNLEPYVIRPQWAAGPDNFPIQNTSQSYMRQCWQNSTEKSSLLEIGINGGLFAEQERQAVRLNFLYNYTVPNRINSSLNDSVISNLTYIWDYTFGVLLQQRVEINNLNDSSLNGEYTITLKETSLWSLPTEGIPGYPVMIICVVTVSTITLTMKKIKGRMANE